MYLKLEDIEDGHKGFGVNDRGIMGQSSDNSGLHVVARSIDHLKNKIGKSHPFKWDISSPSNKKTLSLLLYVKWYSISTI